MRVLNSSIFFWIFCIVSCGRIIIELFVLRHKKEQAGAKKTGLITLYIMTAGYSIAQLYAGFKLLFEIPNAYLYMAGITLFVIGTSGRVYALASLGNAYSRFITVSEHGRLATQGAYSFMRHPLYFFYLVEIAGFCLVRTNLVSLSTWAVVLAAILYRIHEEDRLLADRYGEVFNAYQKRVRRLIPYLW
jgi:protein-S-isoprenylcysteine O-methyltransferase Ste14